VGEDVSDRESWEGEDVSDREGWGKASGGGEREKKEVVGREE